MKTEAEKIVLSLRKEWCSYKAIAKMTAFTKYYVKGICQNRHVLVKNKTGPKSKLNAAHN